MRRDLRGDNQLNCWPSCNIQVGDKRLHATTGISMSCQQNGGKHFSPVEIYFNIQIPGGTRQRSTFPLQSPYRGERLDYLRRVIGSGDSYLTDLEVQFNDSPNEYQVHACITPHDTMKRVCFMDEVISKADAFEEACGHVKEGGVSFLFMTALLIFVCLMIGMAATVIIYRLYRRFRARRPAREPIISDHYKISTASSPPRPFHAQLTVVMEEEEDKCSPSTPIKDFFWRSSSPTPTNTPRALSNSMQRGSPILSNLLPGKKAPTPKPTMV